MGMPFWLVLTSAVEVCEDSAVGLLVISPWTNGASNLVSIDSYEKLSLEDKFTLAVEVLASSEANVTISCSLLELNTGLTAINVVRNSCIRD